MKAGFHQVNVAEDSRKYTAFVTPDGHYEYNRMPFGFANAPSCYQRAIEKALGSLKGSKAYVYLDDVLVTSKTLTEGIDNLKDVLKALSSAGFSLNYDKCTFFASEIEYLGVLISHNNMKPSPRKMSALADNRAPTDVRGV